MHKTAPCHHHHQQQQQQRQQQWGQLMPQQQLEGLLALHSRGWADAAAAWTQLQCL
jgi:hypothetical protein